MCRTRKNYILFKNEGKESVLAGSFSSMKRAKEAIKEDAAREVRRLKARSQYLPNIEYTPDGGRLNLAKNTNISYSIKTFIEDRLE